MIEIPFNIDDGNQEFEISLGDIIYRFEFKYNSRLDRWVFNILNAENEYLIKGISIVAGADFLTKRVNSKLPEGAIISFNTVDANLSPTEETLGLSSRLYYFG